MLIEDRLYYPIYLSLPWFAFGSIGRFFCTNLFACLYFEIEYLAWLLTVVVCVIADGFFSADTLRDACDVAVVSIEPNELLFLMLFLCSFASYILW